MPLLLALGYKGLTGSHDLKLKLDGYNVDTIVDVRYDRGHGPNYWSEELIEDTVRRAGYAYYWDKGLGNPDYKLPGSRYPNSKPATRFAEPASTEPLARMIYEDRQLALMCVCPDTQHCHRRLIINKLLTEVPNLHVISV